MSDLTVVTLAEDSTAVDVGDDVTIVEVGSAGPQGPGVPRGGTAGQAPVKQSSTDFDVAWADVAVQGELDAEAAARAAGDALLVPLTQKAAPDGVATLDGGGKVPQAQLPAIAISDYLGTVANQAAMLALVGQRGDWAIRLDTGSTWVLAGDDASVLGNWQELRTAADAVSSVNGRTGAVTGLAEATDVTGEAATRAAADALLIPLTQRGAANGVATLDAGAKIPDGQIPDGVTRDSELSAAIAALVNSAPGTLDTLAEIATALGNDPNLATTLTNLINAKVSDVAYNAGTWDGVTTIAPSKNAVRDKIEALSGAYVPLAIADNVGARPADRVRMLATRTVSTSLVTPTLVRPYDPTRARIVVQSVGAATVLLAYSLPDTSGANTYSDFTVPPDVTYYTITIPPGFQHEADPGATGQIWAYCATAGGVINIEAISEMAA